MAILKRIWNDENGFIITMELVLIATITVLGLIVGLTAVRDALVAELADVAEAVSEMRLFDESDDDGAPDPPADTCISYSLPPSDEV